VEVHTATLAGGDSNADRVFVIDHAVIVLDGATAFEPVDIDPGTYADNLGSALVDQLDDDPNADLSQVVAAAITRTAEQLQLTPGRSPSSTVSVLHVRDEAVNMYVLGDSPIYYGQPGSIRRLTDDRLAKVAKPEREHYAARLRAGHGYDDDHRAATVALQRAQRTCRNTDGGYWIAEADPSAALRGVMTTVQRDAITWAVLATDGAAEFIDHASHSHDWPAIAQMNAGELGTLLACIHEWEVASDPNGRHLPRAKRHDDKTVAAVPILW
jgi:hypothetical protein